MGADVVENNDLSVQLLTAGMERLRGTLTAASETGYLYLAVMKIN